MPMSSVRRRGIPIWRTAPNTPPDAALSDYLHMLDVLGLQHGVLLQPSIYGRDNACMIAALRAAGGRLRGIVVADPGALSDAVIDDWTAAGVRGVRMSMLAPTVLPFDAFDAIAARLHEIGWHMSLVPDHVDRLVDLEPALRRAPCPVVMEQIGRTTADRPDTPGFTVLLDLLATRRIRVKLSHPYHLSASGFPYADVRGLAQACLAAAPDRCLWATDWPHPMVTGQMPNDGDLLDLADDWFDGDAALRRAVLCDNPAALYL